MLVLDATHAMGNLARGDTVCCVRLRSGANYCTVQSERVRGRAVASCHRILSFDQVWSRRHIRYAGTVSVSGTVYALTRDSGAMCLRGCPQPSPPSSEWSLLGYSEEGQRVSELVLGASGPWGGSVIVGHGAQKMWSSMFRGRTDGLA